METKKLPAFKNGVLNMQRCKKNDKFYKYYIINNNNVLDITHEFVFG